MAKVLRTRRIIAALPLVDSQFDSSQQWCSTGTNWSGPEIVARILPQPLASSVAGYRGICSAPVIVALRMFHVKHRPKRVSFFQRRIPWPNQSTGRSRLGVRYFCHVLPSGKCSRVRGTSVTVHFVGSDRAASPIQFSASKTHASQSVPIARAGRSEEAFFTPRV